MDEIIRHLNKNELHNRNLHINANFENEKVDSEPVTGQGKENNRITNKEDLKIVPFYLDIPI